MRNYGPSMTPRIKLLIIINGIIFLLQFLLAGTLHQYDLITSWFGLRPAMVLENGMIWQVFTYQFLHGGFFHFLFNMFALWMFGAELEMRWGSKEFTKFYLVSGTGAGIFITLLNAITGPSLIPTVGASGAIFAVLLAYAIYWPNRYLLFMFFFPVKVKYFVLGIGIISLLFSMRNTPNGGISHIGHLGGLISGYIYLYLATKGSMRFFSNFESIDFKKIWQNYRKKRQWKKRGEKIEKLMSMEEKIDLLLEKIARYGIKSLSSKEKKFLKEVSEKMNKPTSENLPRRYR